MTANTGKDKEAALEIALGRIEKDYGKGAVMRLGEISQRIATEVIPTGSLTLDLALGVGGIPRGRVTEIYGTEAAGKSTLAIHIMAEDLDFSNAALKNGFVNEAQIKKALYARGGSRSSTDKKGDHE